jgi:hypothetical protein
MLEELGQCQTFDGIKEKCADVLQIIGEKGYEMDYEYFPCIMNTGIAVDECTLSLCKMRMFLPENHLFLQLLFLIMFDSNMHPCKQKIQL